MEKAPKEAIAAAILDEVERLVRCRRSIAKSPRPSRPISIRRLAENLAKVIHAPAETLRLAVLCLVSEGHMIIEDFPGVGKTMLAKAVARSLDCRSRASSSRPTYSRRT